MTPILPPFNKLFADVTSGAETVSGYSYSPRPIIERRASISQRTSSVLDGACLYIHFFFLYVVGL